MLDRLFRLWVFIDFFLFFLQLEEEVENWTTLERSIRKLAENFTWRTTNTFCCSARSPNASRISDCVTCLVSSTGNKLFTRNSLYHGEFVTGLAEKPGRDVGSLVSNSQSVCQEDRIHSSHFLRLTILTSLLFVTRGWIVSHDEGER